MISGTENSLVALSDAMADAVEKAGASTVTVDARHRMPASGIAFAFELVLTADHVVEREDDIAVWLPNGSRVNAALAGRDPGNDLAVLKLSVPTTAVAEVATASARVGQLALAVGRPSQDGLQASLGVISALGGPVRTGSGGLLEKYLQTDAIPYPGFSGGPLVDATGRVLGVNTSGLARGVSLAIPAALAWQVADTLARHGSVRRGYLGIRSQPVTLAAAAQGKLGRNQSTGLLLVGIEDGSPAADGGLIVGDILVGIGESVIDDPDELLARLSGTLVGQQVEVEVLRGGQPARIPVKIGERK